MTKLTSGAVGVRKVLVGIIQQMRSCKGSLAYAVSTSLSCAFCSSDKALGKTMLNLTIMLPKVPGVLLTGMPLPLYTPGGKGFEGVQNKCWDCT